MGLINIFNNSSLNTKIIIVGITGTTLLAIVTIFIGLNNRKIQNTAAVDRYESNTTLALDKGIAAQFYERYGDVQAFSINPALQTKNTIEITEIFNNYAAMYGIYDVILYVDTQGNFIASNNKTAAGKSFNNLKLSKKITLMKSGLKTLLLKNIQKIKTMALQVPILEMPL